MKCLVVEDEFISRTLLTELLSDYGTCHVATNGLEAVEAFLNALDDGHPYDLICLDIMMPHLNGQEALQRIRALEAERGIGGLDTVKVIMTTALDDSKNIMQAFTKGNCEAYLTKPLDRNKLLKHLRELQIID
ncbi:MAG: hypothetical protein BWK76_20740 [Desulfobulbaceae bacterium A2]|nr:MAG: hypothetical protein BWK76_20740 [Desulfobulbaceae bacterium A2]